MSPGSSAVNRLREVLVALKPAGPWRARAVVEEPQVQQCVSLQVESFLNRGADPSHQVERMAQRLRAASVADTDVLLTVDVPGACLGFLWTSLRTLPEGPVCHLNSIVLIEAARGCGLGGELMVGLEDCARQAGFVGMSLNSMADNHRVAAFYRRLALVGTHLRRAMDGSSIAVFDPFFLTPVGSSDAVVRVIVADREHAAREQAAVRAYLTVWGPTSYLALALQGLEYRVGRKKWWKGITRSHHARAI